MSGQLIKKLKGKEFYAKVAKYDSDGNQLSDRRVKSVSVSGRTMTADTLDGEVDVPVVPVPGSAGQVLKSGEAGSYGWGQEYVPGDGRLYVKVGGADPVDTGFSADATRDATLELPVAADGVDGLMSGADKAEFDRISGEAFDAKAERSELTSAVATLERGIDDLSTHVGEEITRLDGAKADKDSDAVPGNLAEFDEGGNPVDSGKTLDDIMLKADVALPLKIDNGILTNNGVGLTVTGNNSWAEGKSTTSSGYVSHAEGYSSTASGAISHAEGYGTIASGGDSHAEGYETTASGSYAHSQGIGTVASGTASMATGQYNLDSTGLLVVGNGSKTNNVITRSDCFKIDSTGKLHFLNYGTLTELNFDTTTFQTQLDGLLVEEGEPLVSEPDTVLFSRLSGNELLARRAYEDENGENIKDTYATKAEMQAALGDIETLLAAL